MYEILLVNRKNLAIKKKEQNFAINIKHKKYEEIMLSNSIHLEKKVLKIINEQEYIKLINGKYNDIGDLMSQLQINIPVKNINTLIFPLPSSTQNNLTSFSVEIGSLILLSLLVLILFIYWRSERNL